LRRHKGKSRRGKKPLKKKFLSSGVKERRESPDAGEKKTETRPTEELRKKGSRLGQTDSERKEGD